MSRVPKKKRKHRIPKTHLGLDGSVTGQLGKGTDEMQQGFAQRTGSGVVSSASRDFFWITTIRRGRTVVLGPYNTEEEANEIGYQQLDGMYQIHTLKTRDQGKATRALKHEKLVDTSNLDESLQRMRHKLKYRRET